ncbi:MAG: hypothetical protein Q9182_005000 [Xanthomendoza sp. 2 TL-2023]
MSSMRNAVQRRNHKERSQPTQREKWGILEKHKDYSLRAKDYSEKKKRLNILREKAAERNPDEFSYGMLSSKTDKHGRKIHDRGNSSLSQDAVKILKTQDAGYIRTLIQQTRRIRENMEQKYLLVNRGSVKVFGDEGRVKAEQHLLFVDNREEQESLTLAQGKQDSRSSAKDSLERRRSGDDTENNPKPPSLVRKDPHQLTLSNEEAMRPLKQEGAVRKPRQRGNETQRSKLSALKARERDLRAAEQELDYQRARMSNSLGGVNKARVKWKVRERKR